MIPGRPLRPQDLLKLVKRWPQIVVPFLLVGIATFAIVRRLPDQFQSETLILVVPQRVPESYVRATVSTRIADRLQSINQQIMSRTRLEPVIREFNLYPRLVQTGMMEDVVARMRRDIVAQPVRGDAFRISYRSDNPRTAMRVTERLASLYIDENLRDREVLADGTNQFLESQMAAAKARLIEHEKKLEGYKRRYAGQMPAQVQTNLQVLQNAQLQVQSLIDSISRDKDRRMVLEGALTDAANASPVIDAGTTTASGTKSVSAGAGQAVTAAQLDAARNELAALEMKYKADHPDVIRQKRLVADLEQRAREEAAAAALLPPQVVPLVVDRTESARVARIAQLRGELDTLAVQIPQKEAEEARLRTVIADYQARVEAAPSRESELVELMRDYDTLERSYTSLLSKKEEAQIAANLERYQIGEQFKVLDPARLPEKPTSPDRPKLYGLGLATGLGLGLALALLLEWRDTTLKTDGDVVFALGLPVLALIPELITDEERTAKRRRRTLASLATASAAAALAGVLFWVFRG